ncbi:hypothetical protein VULLAG_LOCUS22280 [Vulpes lagopus]
MFAERTCSGPGAAAASGGFIFVSGAQRGVGVQQAFVAGGCERTTRRRPLPHQCGISAQAAEESETEGDEMTCFKAGMSRIGDF